MVIERRRTPRVDLPGDQVAGVELRRRVRLLDISLSGALIACDTPLPVGSTGRLRVALASAPFHADLHIQRDHPAPRRLVESGLGAMFASMDESSRRNLEQFLRRASE